MYTLSKASVKRQRIMFSHALGITARQTGPPVEFHFTDNQLMIGVRDDDIQIACREQGPFEFVADHRFTMSFELWREIESSGSTEVQFYVGNQDSNINVQWIKSGTTEARQFPLVECDQPFVDCPADMVANGTELLTAIRQAMLTTTHESSRYALDAIEFDGSRGATGTKGWISGTNGHELYSHGGFDFPFDDKRIISTNKVFQSRDLETEDPIRIGASDDWLSLDFGAWLIQSRIDRQRRYPNITGVIPAACGTESTITVSDSDAELLLKRLPELPAAKEFNSPIVFDLNRKVVIRARGENEDRVTEICLENSRWPGAAITLEMNRKLLTRAMDLGFRQIEVTDHSHPLVCRDDRRTYLWMILSSHTPVTGKVTPATQSKPAAIHANRISPNLNQRSEETNMTTQTSGGSPASKTSPAQNSCRNSTTEQRSVLDQAERVRESLTESLAEVRTLIATLKKRKKQNRLVRDTLASLKQLETVEV